MPVPSELPARVTLLARDGKIIEAIKALREDSGLGLKEAKDAVDAYLSGAQSNSDSAAPTGTVSGAVVDALRRGKKIEAIRMYREQHHCGLKDSKEAIEAYLAEHKELQQHFFNFDAQQKKKLWNRFLALAFIALLLLAYVFKSKA